MAAWIRSHRRWGLDIQRYSAVVEPFGHQVQRKAEYSEKRQRIAIPLAAEEVNGIMLKQRS